MRKTIKLPTTQTITKDNDGFEKAYTNWITGIKATFKDCTRNEILIGLQRGYTAEQSIEVFKGNYSGQAFLVDEETNEKYYIERTFSPENSNYVTLICSRRQKNEHRG